MVYRIYLEVVCSHCIDSSCTGTMTVNYHSFSCSCMDAQYYSTNGMISHTFLIVEDGKIFLHGFFLEQFSSYLLLLIYYFKEANGIISSQPLQLCSTKARTGCIVYLLQLIRYLMKFPSVCFVFSDKNHSSFSSPRQVEIYKMTGQLGNTFQGTIHVE